MMEQEIREDIEKQIREGFDSWNQNNYDEASNRWIAWQAGVQWALRQVKEAIYKDDDSC